MEDQPSAGGNMLQGWEYGCLDLHGSLQPHQEQRLCMSQLPSAFGLVENERQEGMVITDDMTNYAEQSKFEHNEGGKCEDGPPWQRMKWSANMVTLLITVLSYIGEDPSTDCLGSQTKMSSLLRKIGKWKCVSKVMVERGYHVSPQQCEDKFNNLNKSYRRLNDLLGKGISCKVVENPNLLDVLDVSQKGKEEARKILTSKHLFFEEMCSYHNGNRLCLPHDPDLLQSLLSILKNVEDNELHDLSQPALDGIDKTAGVLASEDNGASSGFSELSMKWMNLINENEMAGFVNTSKPLDSNQNLDAQADTAAYNLANSGFSPVSSLWLKQSNENEVAGLVDPLKPWDCNQSSDAQTSYNPTHESLTCPEGNEADASKEQMMADQFCKLEKQKLQLKLMLLKLERQHLKWQRKSSKQDLELEQMRLENKCLKLGNECLRMYLKQRRMELEKVQGD